MKQKQGIIIASVIAIILLIGIIAQFAIDIMTQQAALTSAAQWSACQGFPQNLACWSADFIAGSFSVIGTLFSPITTPLLGSFGVVFQVLAVLVVLLIAALALAFQQGWVKW